MSEQQMDEETMIDVYVDQTPDRKLRYIAKLSLGPKVYAFESSSQQSCMDFLLLLATGSVTLSDAAEEPLLRILHISAGDLARLFAERPNTGQRN